MPESPFLSPDEMLTQEEAKLLTEGLEDEDPEAINPDPKVKKILAIID